jgi:hypothetical protein
MPFKRHIQTTRLVVVGFTVEPPLNCVNPLVRLLCRRFDGGEAAGKLDVPLILPVLLSFYLVRVRFDIPELRQIAPLSFPRASLSFLTLRIKPKYPIIAPITEQASPIKAVAVALIVRLRLPVLFPSIANLR